MWLSYDNIEIMRNQINAVLPSPQPKKKVIKWTYEYYKYTN